MPDVPPNGASGTERPAYYSFDRVAHEYEATRILPERVAEALAERIADGVTPDSWILDAGVGTGRLGRALARRHNRTVGVDVASGMLNQLHRQPKPRPHLALADLRALPFAEETFDRCLAVHIFHLIADWEQAIAEVWRVLRSGGSLFLGFEDRERTEVREQYLDTAIEHGILPRRLGAHSSELLEWLSEQGGRIETEQPEEMRWEYPITATETLAQLERRTYSTVWGVPEREHRLLLKKAREWTLATYGTLEHTETVRIRMLLCTVTKR
jgi:ubiquinone/menaquinone biosynthesis C-methylase UbiE